MASRDKKQIIHDAALEDLQAQLQLQPKEGHGAWTDSYRKMIDKFRFGFKREVMKEYAPGIVSDGADIIQELYNPESDKPIDEQIDDSQADEHDWLRPLALQLKVEPKNIDKDPGLRQKLVLRLSPVAQKLLHDRNFYESVPADKREYVHELLQEAALLNQQEIESSANPNTSLDVLAALYGLAMVAGGTRMVLPTYRGALGGEIPGNVRVQNWFLADQKADDLDYRATVNNENLEARVEKRATNQAARADKRVTNRELRADKQEARHEVAMTKEEQLKEAQEARTTPSPLKTRPQ